MLSERFEMRFAPELVEKIDRWRNAQTVPPSRAAAIRYLIEESLSRHIGAKPNPGSGGNPGPAPRGKLGASRVPRKPAPERKAEPAAPLSKLDQIRALREQGVR
jgi:hypothetical protein